MKIKVERIEQLKSIILTRTNEVLAVTDAPEIPFGTEFQIGERWYLLNFVTSRSYFVQEVPKEHARQVWLKKQREELRKWAIQEGLIDENQAN